MTAGRRNAKLPTRVATPAMAFRCAAQPLTPLSARYSTKCACPSTESFTILILPQSYSVAPKLALRLVYRTESLPIQSLCIHIVIFWDNKNVQAQAWGTDTFFNKGPVITNSKHINLFVVPSDNHK